MSLFSFFGNLEHKVTAWASGHNAALQSAVNTAKVAAVAASTVAVALGEPTSVLTVINGISDGLTKVSSTITSESSATTLTDTANNLAGLVDGLVSSGDIGVKNAATKVAIGSALGKTVAVANVLQSAAAAVSAAAVTTPVKS